MNSSFIVKAIHIGTEIKSKVKMRKMTVVDFAKQLGCHRTHVYRIFESPSIDTTTLLHISVILDFDFFKLYSEKVSTRLASKDLDPN